MFVLAIIDDHSNEHVLLASIRNWNVPVTLVFDKSVFLYSAIILGLPIYWGVLM